MHNSLEEQQKKQNETKYKVKLRLLSESNLKDVIDGKYKEGIEMFDCTTSGGRGLCFCEVEEKEPIIILDKADCIIHLGGIKNGVFIVPRKAVDNKRFEIL